MPHSSGGGSSGGGSHGGSFGGGSGGGVTSHVFGSRTSKATHCYVHYRHNKATYVYSDLAPEQLKKSAGSLAATIFSTSYFVLLILLFGYFVWEGVARAQPLSMNYDTAIIIDDKIGVIDNEDELRVTLTEFRDKTGITPAVFTVYNEDWNTDEHRPNMISHAYDTYISTFDDEKHWLIMYSQSKNPKSDEWFWEAMQGDDTDKILTEKVCNSFINDVQTGLEKSTFGVGEVLNGAFANMNSTDIKKSIDWLEVLGCSGIVFALVYFMVKFIKSERNNRDLVKNIQEVPMTANDEELRALESECAYCDGIYFDNGSGQCPYCSHVE